MANFTETATISLDRYNELRNSVPKKDVNKLYHKMVSTSSETLRYINDNKDLTEFELNYLDQQCLIYTDILEELKNLLDIDNK